jgi:hypothetical protein
MGPGKSSSAPGTAESERPARLLRTGRIVYRSTMVDRLGDSWDQDSVSLTVSILRLFLGLRFGCLGTIRSG